MARYFASPWGFIRGKLDDIVGGYWKGIEWCRVRVLPTQRGTLKLYYDLKAGLITPERFSYKQFNIRRLVLSPMGWMGKHSLANLIYPVWYKLVQKRKLKLTGINMFVKASARKLFLSLPNTNQEYDPVTNKPDLEVMKVSDGDLEATPSVLTASYDPATGSATATWDTTHIYNGADGDRAFVVACVEPVVDGDWEPTLWFYGDARPVGLLTPRSAGTMTIALPTGFSPANVCLYVFFIDAAEEIGYSASKGKYCS